MQWQKVTAIVRRSALESVEQELQQLGVRGLSVSTVEGYGEYANFFSHDGLVTHIRIEVFTDESQARAIAEAIVSSAHSGSPGDGLVAILPVVSVYRIREERLCTPGELSPG